MQQSDGDPAIIGGALMRAYPDRYLEVARLQAADALPSSRAMWRAVYEHLQGQSQAPNVALLSAWRR